MTSEKVKTNFFCLRFELVSCPSPFSRYPQKTRNRNQFPIPPFPHLPPCACSEKCPAAVRGTLFHRNRTSAFLTIPIEANVHALASVTAASIAAG